MTLHEFLALEHRLQWGGVDGEDCMTFAASWVRSQIGIDPAAELRGTYWTEEGAHAILRSHGGAVRFMARHLEPLKFIRTKSPRDGDIGAVFAPSAKTGRQVLVGAIRFGPLWASLSPARVVAKKTEYAAAWSLPA